jgi:hypothetical protein
LYSLIINQSKKIMKPIKMMSLVLLGALALGISSAKAQPLSMFAKVKIALILQKQGLDNVNSSGDGKTYISTIDKMKVNNKDFMNLLEEMFDTTWPEDAQLMYHTGLRQLFVTDITGTNVLFNCGEGVDNSERQAFVSLRLQEQGGPYRGKIVDDIPGSAKSTVNFQGVLWIHYRNYSDDYVYIDLNGAGLDIEEYSGRTTDTEETIRLKGKFTPFCFGYFDSTFAIITGKITVSVKDTRPVRE